MKKILLKALLFFSLFMLLVITGMIIPDTTNMNTLHQSIIDKHKMLENTEGKRIILVGGSNVIFGIYSKKIAKTFKTITINAAIHGGYGLKFILDDLSPFIKQNDLIILAPEYNHFFDDALYGERALIELIDTYPSAMKLFSPKQWFLNIGSIPKIAFRKINGYILHMINGNKKENNNSLFNKYGDAILHWDKKNENIKKHFIEGDFNINTINLIEEFNSIIRHKKAKLFITYPSLQKASFSNNLEKIQLVDQALKKTGIPLLGNPDRYSFSDTLFYDSVYHLSKEGQFLRTELLIEDIKKNIYK